MTLWGMGYDLLTTQLCGMDPRKYGWMLERAGDGVKNNKVLVASIVGENEELFRYVSPELQKDRSFILSLLQRNGRLIALLPENLKDDKVMALAAVEEGGIAINYLSTRLKKDRELVLMAVKKYGLLLSDVEESFKRDKEVVHMAIKQEPMALRYAAEALQQDPECVVAAIESYLSGHMARYFDLPDEMAAYLKNPQIAVKVWSLLSPSSKVACKIGLLRLLQRNQSEIYDQIRRMPITQLASRAKEIMLQRKGSSHFTIRLE